MNDRANQRNEQTVLFYLPRATLVVVSGPLRGRQFELHGAPMRIGRHDVPIPLGSPTVSRRHAQVRYASGSYWIEPGGGQSITYHNNRPLGDPAPLAPGDRIRVAEHVLELRLDAADADGESAQDSPLEPTALRPVVRLTPPPPPRPRRWRRLRRSRAVHASAALLLLLAAAGAVWSQTPPAPRFLSVRDSAEAHRTVPLIAGPPPVIPPLRAEAEPAAEETTHHHHHHHHHHHARTRAVRLAGLPLMDRAALEAVRDQTIVEYRAARAEHADAISDGDDATQTSAAASRLEAARRRLQLLGRMLDSITPGAGVKR